MPNAHVWETTATFDKKIISRYRDAVSVEDSGGPRETPVHIADRFEANTVLCSFNTIQPSSL